MNSSIKISIAFFVLLGFISFLPAATINGTVTDVNTGSAVAGASITAFGYNPANPDSIIYRTSSGANGSYSIPNALSGTYYIWCEHPNYFQGSQGGITITDSLSTITVDFALMPRNTVINNLISGVVYSTPRVLPTFIPIPGATVHLRLSGISVDVVSDSSGYYEFTNIMPNPPGAMPYMLSAEAPGHYPANYIDTIVVTPNTWITGLDIYLVPFDSSSTSNLSGFVYEADSSGTFSGTIYPATVTIFSYNPIYGDSLFFTTTTNPDGSYLFNNVVPGIYDGFCEASGYFPGFANGIDLTSGSATYDFYLIPDNSGFQNKLSGKVLDDQSGAPINRAIVNLMLLDSAGYSYTTHTSNSGYYEFTSLTPGFYEISAASPGYLPMSTRDSLYISSNTIINNFDLFLTPDSGTGGAFLTGFVWGDSTNYPVHPADIMLVGYSPTGDSLFYFTRNQPDGSYIIPNIMPGTYTGWCNSAGYQTQYVHNLVITNNINHLDFYLSSSNPIQRGFITGTVTSDIDGSPIPWTLVEFISMNGWNFHTSTDLNGDYNSPPLPVGDYYVACYFMPPDSTLFYMEYYDDVHSLSNATVLTVGVNDTINNIDFGIPVSSTISNITVSGNVTDDSNIPLGNAAVTIWVEPTPGMGGDSLIFRGFTDNQGNYTINITHNYPRFVTGFIVSAIKQGYDIEFWQEKATPYEADRIWVYGDTTISNIDFTLQQHSAVNSISGIITSNNGGPLSNAFIIGADINNAQIVFTFSDSSGHYTLGSLNESNYYLLFAADGHVPEFYDDVLLWENATPVYASGNVLGIDASLMLISPNPSNGAIAGTILDNNNLPLSGALMIIKNNLGQVIGYDMTDGQGAYEITGVISGDYNVSASKVSYGSEMEAVVFNSTIHTTMLVNFDLNQSVAGIPEEKETLIIPTELELASNFPNPFNPETKISIGLPNTQHVKIVVYNLLGQSISELANGELPAGRHSFIWNGTDSAGKHVSSGIYFYSLETADQRLVKKMIFSK